MKRALSSLLLLASLSLSAQRTVITPYIENEQNKMAYFSIDKVTLSEESTALDMTVTVFKGIGACIVDATDGREWKLTTGGKKYKMISNTFPSHSEKSRFDMSANESRSFKVIFEPIPLTTERFDLIDNMNLSIYGVDLTKTNNINEKTISENWGKIGSDKATMKITRNFAKGEFFLIDENGQKWQYYPTGQDQFSRSENNTSYILSYETPTTILAKQVRTSDFMGLTTTQSGSYRMVKDMTDHLDDPVNILNSHGLVFRYTYNYGKIGEDYVPAYYTSYNAGKKFIIDGVEIQEKDMRSYVSDGDYSKDINGYTYVYQTINPTASVVMIRYKVSGHGAYPNIEKASFWNFSKKYQTIDEYKDFNLSNCIVLKPNETYKDQIKIGTKKPIDMEFKITTVKELDAEWYNNLQKALTTQTDLVLINSYLSDPKAKDWHTALYSQAQNISAATIKKFENQFLPFIKTSVKPQNELMFDKDFDSDVLFTIKNTSGRGLKVVYSVCGGPEQTTTIFGGAVYQGTTKTKGIAKEALTVNVITVKP